VTAYEKDLVVLVPDKNAQFLVDGMLSQSTALGLREPRRQLDTHPLRDAGCLDADELLESQADRYAHAIVIANRELTGCRELHRIDAEAALEVKLSRAGWGSRARAVVIDPGVGRWMLEHQLGERWSPGTPAEEAVESALRRRRIPQSPALYRALGESLVREGEPDPAWQRLLSTLRDWFGATPSDEAAIAARFDALVGRWLEDTQLSSSLREIVSHPAYQEIIAMGREAVPLILRDLERQPRHWNAALKAITGATPVPKEHAGKLTLVAEDWLRWARENRNAW
jgi:hypothetical protein